jgi:hypothetical protein
MKKPIKIVLTVLLSIVGLFVALCIVAVVLAEKNPSVQTVAKPQVQPPVEIDTDMGSEFQEQPVVQKPESEMAEVTPQLRNPDSNNLLMKAKLREVPVINGLKQNIGTRAYISIPQKTLLEDVSFEDVAEFYLSFQGKGYNWVSIICPEGTGLVFPASRGIATYGELDKEGRMTEKTHWSIIYDEKLGTFKEFSKP